MDDAMYTLTVTRPDGTTYPVITSSGHVAEYTHHEAMAYVSKWATMEANATHALTVARALHEDDPRVSAPSPRFPHVITL